MAIAEPPPADTVPRGTSLEEIPLELIDVGDNVRTSIDEASIAELAESIAAVGVLQPIRVQPRWADQRYDLVYGQRRLLAASKAGLSTIPAIIDAAAAGAIEQLTENIQREDLNPLEEARALKRILEADPGLTQTVLAKRLGRSAPWVANALRLLDLAKPVQQLVMEGKLSGSHAKAIAGVDKSEQERIANNAVTSGYSAHRLEQDIAWARQRVETEAKNAAGDAEAIAQAVELLEAKAVPKDAVLWVSSFDHAAAAIKKAGWKTVKTGYPGTRPKTCTCTAWQIERTYERKLYVRPACDNEKHRQAAYSAQGLKRQQKAQAAEVLRIALRDRLAADVVGAQLPELFSRVLLWHLIGYQREAWTRDRVPKGTRKPDTWQLICALKPDELRDELARRLMEGVRGYGADFGLASAVESLIKQEV